METTCSGTTRFETVRYEAIEYQAPPDGTAPDGTPPDATTRHEEPYGSGARIGVLTLARPDKHNALNPRMWEELAAVGELASADDGLRCLIVAGQGESFSAGMDLAESLAGPLSEIAAGLARDPGDASFLARGMNIAQMFEWIPLLRCPSIAAVRGHALGAGLQLALACDFRILSGTARVGLPEIRHGLLPDMGATFRLPRIVGEGRARRLILLGDVLDADEAARIGLADQVVPDDRLDDTALESARRIASRPPLALSGARRAIDAGWRLPPRDALRTAVEAQARCLASDDFLTRTGARPSRRER